MTNEELLKKHDREKSSRHYEYDEVMDLLNAATAERDATIKELTVALKAIRSDFEFTSYSINKHPENTRSFVVSGEAIAKAKGE